MFTYFSVQHTSWNGKWGNQRCTNNRLYTVGWQSCPIKGQAELEVDWSKERSLVNSCTGSQTVASGRSWQLYHCDRCRDSGEECTPITAVGDQVQVATQYWWSELSFLHRKRRQLIQGIFVFLVLMFGKRHGWKRVRKPATVMMLQNFYRCQTKFTNSKCNTFSRGEKKNIQLYGNIRKGEKTEKRIKS